MLTLPLLRRAGRSLVVPALLGLATTLILWPLSGRDWLMGHNEGMRYLALAEHFRRALRETGSYPRWLSDLYGGYGYPTFVFYQPFIFFLDAFWRTILPGTRALWATLWTLLFTGGLGSYLLARRFGGVGWGLTVAGTFLLSPYLYVDLFVRQALSELSSFILLPWILLALLLVRERTQSGRGTAGALLLLSGSFAALLYAHPLTSILFLAFIPPVVLTLCFRGRKPDLQVMSRVVLGFGLGLLLSAPYWLPFLLMKSDANLAAASSYDSPTRHTVYWAQFFSRAWGFGGSIPDSADDGMPFQLGAMHFALSLLAVFASRKRALSIAALVAYLLAILAMTPACAWVWTLPGLKQVQFPWRALAVTSALQVMILAGAGPAFSRLRRSLQLLVALAILTSIAFWQKEQFQVGTRIVNADAALRAELRATPYQIQRYAGTDEFRPKTTPPGDPEPLGDKPILSADRGVLSFEPESNRNHIVANVTTSKTTWLRLHQLYFPGWFVSINGQSVPDQALKNALRRDGTMRVRLEVAHSAPATHFHIEAHYAGPRGGSIATALMVTAALILAGIGLLERRRRRTRLELHQGCGRA